MTALFHDIIFGPVHSRRLGLSLGVNLLPLSSKLCSFDCIYCECGWNAEHPGGRRFNSREDVRTQLEATLRRMVADSTPPDVITFAGNGEPTMHPDFEAVIGDTIALRDALCPAAKVSVLSNATQIHRDSVRRALLRVDNNILKLDSAFDATVRRMNNPQSASYTVRGIVEAMKRFDGRMILQTMFLRGECGGHSGGLTRNIVQCLQDFDIPLYLSHTIVDIQGDTRVEKAIVAKVDENRRPIPGTEMEFDVDTILLSVGLIPENELTRQAGIPMDPHTKGAVVYENMETGIPGVFACGNVVHVHDLVDFVSGESDRAGAAAAAYVLHGETPDAAVLDLVPGNGVGYTVPQRVRPADVDKGVEISFRVRQNYGPSQITITCGEKQLARFKRQRMAPGEMEHITLPGVLLAKADGPLTVAVEEVVAK